VRGCSGFILIVDRSSGVILQQYPRKTRELLLIDQDCYEPDAFHDELPLDVPRPLPLGRMAKRLEEIAAQGVAVRSIDFYAAIATAKSSFDEVP
jgi:hypothetical protein